MRAVVLSTLILGVGCSSSHPPGDVPDSSGPPRADARDPGSPDANVSVPDAAPTARFACGLPRPAGALAPEAPPPPFAGCPTLAAGYNTLTSSANDRQFLLVLPADPQPGETFPVLFMWHWLGGSADGFYERGEVQAAADDQRFIGVIPVAKGATVFGTSLNTKWPFDITQTTDRMNEEFTFFDDMLACVEAQYAVNADCVSTIGVSAGALFTDQLAQARSNRLASFVSLSGGVGATIIKPWAGSARPLPGLVMWGGDGPPAMDGNRDLLGCFGIGMDFSVASNDLENALIAGGHFFVECEHNCGHVEPPLDTPPGESKFSRMWQFSLDHPFWLAPGDSPWLDHGIPEYTPAWCGIGQGGATPRTGGGCPPAENPCPS